MRYGYIIVFIEKHLIICKKMLSFTFFKLYIL